MKIFINNRNWLTWPKAMARQLADQGHEIIFIDNGSTYEPLLDYYDTKEFAVIYLPNLGARAPWMANIVTGLKEPFVVTDPDYDLQKVPTDWPEVLSDGFFYFGVDKVGLSFDESIVPPENPAWHIDKMGDHPNDSSIAWEPMPHGFCNYPVDTSFAVYQKGGPFVIGGIRKGRPYTGIHLPWHLTLEPGNDPTKLYVPYDDEAHFYFTHCENSSYTWGRLQEMTAEYDRRTRQG